MKKFIKKMVSKFLEVSPWFIQHWYPETIQYVDNPSEKLQLIAVNSDPTVYRYISNPTIATQLTLVSTSPRMIREIKDPSREVQIMAVTKDMGSIKYIQNPHPDVLSLMKNHLTDDNGRLVDIEVLINIIKPFVKDIGEDFIERIVELAATATIDYVVEEISKYAYNGNKNAI